MRPEAQIKHPKRAVNGVLLLSKPRGLTSNAALQRTKRLFQAEKAGHTGTLDPLAEGLLPVCFGEATKFSSYQLEADKGYRAEICLGITTATGDVEGEVLHSSQVNVDAARLHEVINAYIGEIMQVPPMYSALKVQGKPLYTYARAGEEIVRQARKVQIRSIKVLKFDSPQLEIEVRCSAGTYIRTLAEDIGVSLGCGGAHLTGLLRLSSGGFRLEQAIELEVLETLTLAQQDALLLPMDVLVKHLPKLDVDSVGVQALTYGRPFMMALASVTGLCRAYDEEHHFLGLVERAADGMTVARRLMRVKDDLS